MALRRKVLLVIGGALAGLIITLYLVSQSLLLNSYLNLEDQTVQRNVQRALNNLQGELESLSRSTADWAYWDETYRFVQDRNTTYESANIVDSTFAGLNVNLMLFIDNQGQLVLGKAFDLNTSRPSVLPSGLESSIGAGSPLIATGEKDEFSGIVMLNDVPILMASRAILTGDKKGPVMGTVIFGRVLDDARIAQIAQQTQLTLAIRRLNDPQLPPDFQSASARLSPTSNVVVQPLNNELVDGYTTLNDINGTPVLYLKVELNRDIYVQGQASLSIFILEILVAGIIIIGVTLILIERLVLSRLVALSAEMETVSASGDPSARLNITGDDELAYLGNDINRMLHAIEQAQAALRKNEERLQTMVTELEASQSELLENDHQLQMTVSRLETQKRQFQRVNEFVRSTVLQMEDTIQRGAAIEEVMQYMKNVQKEFSQLDLMK